MLAKFGYGRRAATGAGTRPWLVDVLLRPAYQRPPDVAQVGDVEGQTLDELALHSNRPLLVHRRAEVARDDRDVPRLDPQLLWKRVREGDVRNVGLEVTVTPCLSVAPADQPM